MAECDGDSLVFSVFVPTVSSFGTVVTVVLVSPFGCEGDW